jgi:hypothetical protein
MKQLHTGLLALALLSTTACATITKGTEDTVNIQSAPAGAEVTFHETSGKLADQYCETPCVMELNRKFTYKVLFEKEGYEQAEGRLEPKFSGDGAAGMAGNVLFGGIVGAAIDGSTGAMNDLKPNPLSVSLKKLESATAAAVEVVEDAIEAVSEEIQEASS